MDEQATEAYEDMKREYDPNFVTIKMPITRKKKEGGNENE